VKIRRRSWLSSIPPSYNKGTDVAQLQRRFIQIAQGAQPLFFPEQLGLRDGFRDEHIQYIQRIIQRSDLKRMGEGHERGYAPLIGHTGDGRCPGLRGVAGQGAQPRRR
jgi:hypothetical protein